MSDAGDARGGRDESEGDGRAESNPDRGGRPCPVCGEPLYSRHCKYVCPQHGVVYDCSDTFY
ncbi:HVO_2523 family zinc finger protein [Halorussus halobius]|uniref:HVO_2523 family zinc finger protein n=1 Tax=Halorussus halobius TaxID=1710537 RepID=UPI0010928B74